LSLRINAVFVLGAVILLAVKFIQDGGILRSANTTKILGISAMIPLLLIGIVPILTGDIVKANFFPLVPLAHDARGRSWRRHLEHGGHHGVCRRHVPRRLVDLRLRDRGVLHRGIQEPEDRHLQGDFLFRACCASWCTRWCRSHSRAFWDSALVHPRCSTRPAT
jgi:hypothetical protein